MGRILVSGVSGPIGAALLPSLEAQGHKITRLVRSMARAGQIAWDPAQPLRPAAVAGFDAVVHLAGESIVGRWTAAKKRRILESRVDGTRHLAAALAETRQRPEVFICASAVGYYGNRGDEVLLEESASGEGFLAEVCRQWEAAAKPASDAGIRTVHMRFGLVLSPTGGALPRMLPPFRMGVGGRVGSGRQWWSWIEVSDIAGAVPHILANHGLHGPVNVVAPNPVTNAEFTRVLASVLHRPAVFPLPAFPVRLAFGEMGEELLLASQRVEAGKLLGSGYRFQHPELRGALEGILKG